ncbi:MAG: hypothetical protein MJA29_08950 [Candidatus Omnitrophica bacterium]|nr:hypothetical protein [Candidatus Omnitrophota bacterium]
MVPLRKIVRKQLGELLIDSGILTQERLDRALALQKEKGGLIGELLVEMGFVGEEDIAQALTVQYGFPYLPLNNYDINPEIVRLIPSRIARQYILIPIDKIGSNFTIVMSNPLNLQAIEDIELLSGCKVQTFVSTSSDIKKAIAKYYNEEQ